MSVVILLLLAGLGLYGFYRLVKGPWESNVYSWKEYFDELKNNK